MGGWVVTPTTPALLLQYIFIGCFGATWCGSRPPHMTKQSKPVRFEPTRPCGSVPPLGWFYNIYNHSQRLTVCQVIVTAPKKKKR